MSKLRRKPALLRFRPALEMLEDRRLLAIIAWDGGGDGTSWNQAANWDGDVLPGADDDVIIDLPDQDVTVRINSSVTVKSLTSEEDLRLDRVTLELAEASALSGSLFMDSSTIGGSGDLSRTLEPFVSMGIGLTPLILSLTISVPSLSLAAAVYSAAQTRPSQPSSTKGRF